MKSTLLIVIAVAVVIIAACAVYSTLHRHQEAAVLAERHATLSCIENAQAHQLDILVHGGTAAQQDAANDKAFKACASEGTK
jgi:uncharacterized protein YxeA